MSVKEHKQFKMTEEDLDDRKDYNNSEKSVKEQHAGRDKTELNHALNELKNALKGAKRSEREEDERKVTPPKNDHNLLLDVKDEPMDGNDLGEEEDPPEQHEELVSYTRTSARVLLRKQEDRKVSEGSEDYDHQQGGQGQLNGDQCHNGDHTGASDHLNYVDGDHNRSSQLDNCKRTKRAWECWSTSDKNHFFEALNECGKNFDAVQQSFQAKKFKKNKSFLKPGF